MSWQNWVEELRQSPQQAVTDLLSGAAAVSPFERAEPHEFLLAILPRGCRTVSQPLLGEKSSAADNGLYADLPPLIDRGLSGWLLEQRQSTPPSARKLGAYAARVSEALQWPLYFSLPKTRQALHDERAQWLQWCSSLCTSAYRDPEYDYWQVLASQQTDDSLQFFWRSFVTEAGRTRSLRYLNLGLLALARLPLQEEDSLRNLRLQVQALIDRYRMRQSWGDKAQEDLAQQLRGVMARNPSLLSSQYRSFLSEMLTGLGEHRQLSILSLMGLAKARPARGAHISYRRDPPGNAEDAGNAVRAVNNAQTLGQAWQAIEPLLTEHEAYVQKCGDAFSFVRTLDQCARALCKRFTLHDPAIQSRLFQWIHLSLRLDAEEPTRWMLWELALRQAGQPQRAQWVLWEMTRRFPDHLPCRVELARLLANSTSKDEQVQANRLLRQVLDLDPEHLHAHSTLAQLAIRDEYWPSAIEHAQHGLNIAPENGHCTVLLANAYARRNGPGDMEMAIAKLRKYTTNYPGNPEVEGYLGRLLNRTGKASAPVRHLNSQSKNTAPQFPAETDPAWHSFAASLQDQRTPNTANPVRLPLLPEALHDAAEQQQWQPDVLLNYEATVQQEFPLEVALWRYLQALAAENLPALTRAKSELQARCKAETEAQGSDAQYLTKYLQQREQKLGSIGLQAGREWLLELLERHRPLPAVLLAA